MCWGGGIAAGKGIIGTGGCSASLCSHTALPWMRLQKGTRKVTAAKLPVTVTAARGQRSTCASDRGKAAGGYAEVSVGVDALKHGAAPWVDAPLGFFGCLQKGRGGRAGTFQPLGRRRFNQSQPSYTCLRGLGMSFASSSLFRFKNEHFESRGGVGIQAQRQQTEKGSGASPAGSTRGS